MTAAVDLQVEGESDVVLAIAAASGWATRETLEVRTASEVLPVTESLDNHGGRLHRVTLPVGPVQIRYDADVATPATPAPSDDLDAVRYLRPSRYVPSDALGDGIPRFDGATPRELASLAPEWVADALSYVSGSSGPADSALDTLRRRQGVCRDYAHVTIALLRARGVPARLVSVYAPGLSPMDFHAVVEAFVDGRWEVVDATRLAPRPHFVRIATGRDAADTAFLTTLSGTMSLTSVEVTAVAVDAFTTDDHADAVLLR